MRIVRDALWYCSGVAFGLVVGYVLGVVAQLAARATNVGAILETLLPPDMATGLLFWIGNAVFLAVFGFFVGTSYISIASHPGGGAFPTGPGSGPGGAAGIAAVAATLVLIVAGDLLLRPGLVAVEMVAGIHLEETRGDSVLAVAYVWGAYGVLGGLAGLVAGHMYERRLRTSTPDRRNTGVRG